MFRNWAEGFVLSTKGRIILLNYKLYAYFVTVTKVGYHWKVGLVFSATMCDKG